MSGRPVVVADRPVAGPPRPYVFPDVERMALGNGLRVATAALPGRPLVAASLVIARGAADEPDPLAGATVLMARALTEGTERYDAVQLTEAAERLGTSIQVDAGWDGLTVSVDVPVERLPEALGLIEEVLARPVFPEGELERLRDERLNDLLQARADPRRRAEEAFVAAVYGPDSPYRRPLAGTDASVRRIDRDAVVAEHRTRMAPQAMTLIVGGDVRGVDVPALAADTFASWAADRATGPAAAPDSSPADDHRRILVVDRPGSVQTEIRIGHPGVARRVDDYHAIALLSATLGGLFNSRLNHKLREEKGYTYGAHAGFDMRRGAGPFSARAAVNTDVTVPAVVDMLAELDRIRDGVTPAELTEARDYLVGVFPLRFETAGAVVGAIGGLVLHDLPDDELARYRASMAAVTVADVDLAARTHVRPEAAAIVLVGDADAFLPALEAAELGPITVERECGRPRGEAADASA